MPNNSDVCRQAHDMGSKHQVIYPFRTVRYEISPGQPVSYPYPIPDGISDNSSNAVYLAPAENY